MSGRFDLGKSPRWDFPRASPSLCSALRDVVCPPPGWDATRGPLTWVFRRGAELLATGRRQQLDLVAGEPTDVEPVKLEVRRSLDWEVTPHAAYYLPLLAATPVNDESFAVYSDVLLLLTAIDGGESIPRTRS